MTGKANFWWVLYSRWHDTKSSCLSYRGRTPKSPFATYWVLEHLFSGLQHLLLFWYASYVSIRLQKKCLRRWRRERSWRKMSTTCNERATGFSVRAGCLNRDRAAELAPGVFQTQTWPCKVQHALTKPEYMPRSRFARKSFCWTCHSFLAESAALFGRPLSVCFLFRTSGKQTSVNLTVKQARLLFGRVQHIWHAAGSDVEFCGEISCCPSLLPTFCRLYQSR